MINLTEDYERDCMLRRALHLPVTDHASFLEKWFALRGCGVSKEEADKLCEPKEIDREQQMKEVAELCRREQRELAKYNREQAKLRKTGANLQMGPEIAPESFIG